MKSVGSPVERFQLLPACPCSITEGVAGIERADSIAFDLHKWVYLPFEVGCVLVRHPGLQAEAFALRASYLPEATRGVMAAGLPFEDRGIDLTRSFKALKVWMSLKAHGVHTLGRLIEQNVRQAQYLCELIERRPERSCWHRYP